MKNKLVKDELHIAMEEIVRLEFYDTMRKGVIVVSIEEMTNVFINLLAEFIEFKKYPTPSEPRREKE